MSYKTKAQWHMTIQFVRFREPGWGWGIVGSPGTKYLT